MPDHIHVKVSDLIFSPKIGQAYFPKIIGEPAKNVETILGLSSDDNHREITSYCRIQIQV